MKTPIHAKVIEKTLGWKVRWVKLKQKGVYRFQIVNGKNYGIKEMTHPRRNLIWIDKSLQVVRNNGFRRIGWRNPRASDGKKLSIKPNRSRYPYVVFPWINGRWPNANSLSDMRACGITLAKFHKAGNLRHLPRSGAVNKVGSWLKDLHTQHLFLDRAMNRSKPYIKSYHKEILSYSTQSRQLLRTQGYHAISHKQHSLRSLCHGDGGPTNFIINAQGTHLIDFETLRIDLRAYDLNRVIYNSCKDHSWRFSIARAILDGYQSITRLRKPDFLMLHSLLRFPQTCYLLLRKLRYSPNLDHRTFHRAVNAERKITTFLKQLDHYSQQR